MVKIMANIFSGGKTRRRSCLLMLMLFLIFIMAAACEPAAPIKIRNGTNEQLKIFVSDRFASNTELGDVAPQGEIKNTVVMGKPGNYTIIAKDTKGNIIYQEVFTLDDLRWLNGRIVIPSSRIPQK